jgi:GH24 family phage-related lysozyme (muramidase)
LTPAALTARLALIQEAEGFRSDVYDDSNDAPIRLVTGGVPTGGDGCACRGWSPRLAAAVLVFQFNEAMDSVQQALPWSGRLDDVRFGTLCEMQFNLGSVGLLGFQKFLAHLEAGEYAAAGLQLTASVADREEPTRIARWVREINEG